MVVNETRPIVRRSVQAVAIFLPQTQENGKTGDFSFPSCTVTYNVFHSSIPLNPMTPEFSSGTLFYYILFL